jgi:hypothetical protein
MRKRAYARMLYVNMGEGREIWLVKVGDYGKCLMCVRF